MGSTNLGGSNLGGTWKWEVLILVELGSTNLGELILVELGCGKY